MMRTIYSLTVCCILFSATQLLAQDGDEVVDSSELDRALLEDLDSDLFDGLDLPIDIPDKKKPDDPNAIEGEGNQPEPFDRELVRDLGEEADPLTKIGQQMQDVQRQMSAGNAKQETLDQQIQIVKAIDDLIEEMKKQQQQQKKQQQKSSSKQNQQKQQQQQKNQQQKQQNQQKPSGSQQPMPMQGESQDQQNQANSDDKKGDAKNSDEELRNQKIELLPIDARNALLKETWGHLPEKIRQQLMNTSIEKFLPKYEKLTEDYFRKLAEETSE